MTGKTRIALYATLLFMQFAAVFEMALALSFGPVVVGRFSLNPENIGFTALGFVASGLFSPLVGKAIRTLGLKPTFFLMGVLIAVGNLGVSMAGSAWAYALSRSLSGLAYFSLLGLAPLVVVRFTDEHQVGAVSGMFKISFATAIALAPIAGVQLLSSVGFPWIYRILSLAGLAASVAILLLPGIPADRERREVSKRSTEPGSFLPFFLSSVAIPVPIALISTYLGVHLASKGMGQGEIGLIYTVMGLGSIAAGIYALLLSDRIGKYRSALVALILIVLALAVLLPSRGWSLYALCFLFYLGFDTYTAMFFPTVGLCFPKSGSRVLTMMSAAQSLGMLLISFVAPAIYNIGFGLNTIVAVGFTIACFFLFRLGYRNARTSRDSGDVSKQRDNKV